MGVSSADGGADRRCEDDMPKGRYTVAYTEAHGEEAVKWKTGDAKVLEEEQEVVRGISSRMKDAR